MEINGPIYIPSSNEEYGFLNPFYKVENGFLVNGLKYNSAEHFFQSKKFEYSDESYSETIRLSSSSNRAHELGTSSKGGILRPDWDSVKYEVMYEANLHKFSQNPELKKRLLDTGDRKLTQSSIKDKYWSVTKEGGRDLLGIILMEVRKNLRSNDV